MTADILRLFICYAIIAVGQSFQLRTSTSPPLRRNAHSSCTRPHLSPRPSSRSTAFASGSGSLSDDTRKYDGEEKSSHNRKRKPNNKRMALRWVVQGVERSLADQEFANKSTGEKSYTYKRRTDASLVDALYLLVNSKSQNDILEAGQRIQVLMKIGRGQGGGTGEGKDFPMETVERVIKATSMVGLVSLSLDLLKSLLHAENESIPSVICYTAVLNALRKNGRIDRLEETLSDLASASRRIQKRQKSVRKDSSSMPPEGNITGVNIVAFNTYLAALCDAAVNELPFPSSEVVDYTNIFDDEMSVFQINFQSFKDSSTFPNDESSSQSQITPQSYNATTSPSEKYLFKALNLLKHDIARTRFTLAEDPDLLSYNTILTAAAKCSKNSNAKQFTRPVIEACLRWMDERGIKSDVFTYNARIQAAVASSPSGSDGDIQEGHISRGEKDAMKLIDQLISHPHLVPDRYTINLSLVPFLHAGRQDEIWHMLEKFYYSNINLGNGKLISSAFEAFLSTLVQNGEVDFAREMFDSFLLPETMRKPRLFQNKQKQRMQLSNEIQVMKTETNAYQEMLQQQQSGSVNRGSVSSSERTSSAFGLAGTQNRPSPTTRQFNILLGGYSRTFQSALSRQENSSRIVIDDGTKGQSNAKDPADNTTSPNSSVNEPLIEAKKAYKLLDTMLEIGIPLDGFSVSSLMAFPTTSFQITALWRQIEPELTADLNPAAYRSIISAYGKAGDISSACFVFEELGNVCGYRGRNVECWNVLLGALANGCKGVDYAAVLDIANSRAAQLNSLRTHSDEPDVNLPDPLESRGFVPLVNGKTCIGASTCILEIMRNGTLISQGSKLMQPPKPNSQTYCLVASALARSCDTQISKSNSNHALQLFRDAMDQGVTADGRFLNALLRCFGADINGALAAWKSDIGAAAAKFDLNTSDSRKQTTNRGANLLAAYNGLMHVCGRALRPDVALRIAYAMQKTAGIEPTETSLNCYYAGKRAALGGNDDKFSFNTANYESLLSVECTKYNTNDTRRAGDKKIRIIL